MEQVNGTNNRQRGAILPLVAISLLVILGMAALALDMSNAHLEKTRLQNALDAAALSAAKVLDQTGNVGLADAAGQTTFSANAAAPGNSGLGEAMASGTLSLTLEFSSTLNPFIAGTTPAQYVRASVASYGIAEWFAPVFGFNDLAIAGTAVAGPSPSLQKACNVVPMMACGTPRRKARPVPPSVTAGGDRAAENWLRHQFRGG